MQVEFISEDTDISVGADGIENIEAAIRSLDNKVIAAAATVRIVLKARSTHLRDEPIQVSHVNGKRIRIVGLGSGDDRPLIRFAQDIDGVLLSGGDVLGGVQNLRLKGGWDSSAPIDPAAQPLGSGFRVEEGAMLLDVRDVEVSTFGQHGFFATRSARIFCRGNGVEVHGVRDNAFLARFGSAIHARNARAIQNSNGFAANAGSYVDATDAEANDNRATGFFCAGGSAMQADRAQSMNNGQFGFFVGGIGFLSAQGATAKGSGLFGFHARTNALLSTSSPGLPSPDDEPDLRNEHGDFSPLPNLESTEGAHIFGLVLDDE